MKLLVLAAGLGSRFGGVKQLARIGPAGETLLEYNVFDALEAGFDGVVFLIRRNIEADFKAELLSRLPGDIPVEMAFQTADACVPAALGAGIAAVGRKKPWGTGHALLCARKRLERGPFAVINADDFYGRKGFAAVHDFLAVQGGGFERGHRPAARASAAAIPGPAAAAPVQFCLAGYGLGGVVPAKGSVSRAICSVGAGGFLEKIVEHTRVERRSGAICSIRPDGSLGILAPGLAASMNLWGLTPEVFPRLEKHFEEFLSDPARWSASEFYLPSAIGDMIDAGAARVRVLPVEETYFGLTNPDDIVEAKAAAAARTERGEYPSPLWGRGWEKQEGQR